MKDRLIVPADRHQTAFDPRIPPVLEIDPGDVVTFETSDEPYRRLAAGEDVEAIGLERFNTVTGPVRVRGAEPGDAVRVDVLDIAIERAWAVRLPGFGRLGRATDGVRIWRVPVEAGWLSLSPRLRVPMEPMIGCIGLAPLSGASSTFSPAYPWGGNLDVRELSPGAAIWLPVQVPGALLSLGDLHAAMGTGEPALVAIEAAGRATVRVGLDKGAHLTHPRLRLRGATACLGMGQTLAAAQEHALDQAFALLTSDFCLDPPEAYAYICARVELRLGGPASPMVLAVVPDIEGMEP